MEVKFTDQEEAELTKIALRDGKSSAADVVKAAGLRVLEEDARFRAAVAAGEASADQDVFIEEEVMDARIKTMLES